MRYIIKSGNERVLSWLLDIDAVPGILPEFPEDPGLGLVVAHLVSGSVLAEVIPHRGHFKAACGEGLPLGRLYFQIPKDRLYSVCSDLTPDSFSGG
jgi:hypothetical protein